MKTKTTEAEKAEKRRLWNLQYRNANREKFRLLGQKYYNTKKTGKVTQPKQSNVKVKTTLNEQMANLKFPENVNDYSQSE